MRDLIERHDAFGRAMMADLTAPGPRAEPAGGDRGGPATSVWSGGGNGRQRASEGIGDAMSSGLRRVVIADPLALDAVMLAARACVGSVWDRAVTLAAEEGPLPLASPEPWVEGDEEYRGRLVNSRKLMGLITNRTLSVATTTTLDEYGDWAGLPRARLVPVEG